MSKHHKGMLRQNIIQRLLRLIRMRVQQNKHRRMIRRNRQAQTVRQTLSLQMYRIIPVILI